MSLEKEIFLKYFFPVKSITLKLGLRRTHQPAWCDGQGLAFRGSDSPACPRSHGAVGVDNRASWPEGCRWPVDVQCFLFSCFFC